MKKRFVYLAIAVLVGLTGMVNAEQINIAFHNGQMTILDPAQSAGVAGVSSANWNNIANNGGTGLAADDIALSDSEGDATAVTLSYKVGATWYSSLPWTSNDDYQMMEGWFALKADDNGYIRVDNIPAGWLVDGYDVYIYCDSGETGANVRTMTYTIGTTSITAKELAANFSGTYVEATDGVLEGNYVVFRGLKTAGFELTAGSDIGRAAINGMQIVPVVIGKLDSFQPANGTEYVSQQPTFSWEDADATGGPYMLYLGTEPNHVTAGNPQEAAGIEVTANSYTPSEKLIANQQYYWRVDNIFKGAASPIVGPKLSFTTNGKAGAPFPADTVTGAATQPVLSWFVSDSVPACKVWFAKSGQSLVELPGIYTDMQVAFDDIAAVLGVSALDENAAYQWRVDTYDDQAATILNETGDVWTFTTGQLMGYWPLDGNSGDTVASNDGTVFANPDAAGGANPVFVAGMKGQGAYFDGTSLFKIGGDASYWDATNKSLTVTSWMKWNDNESTNAWTGWITRSGLGDDGGWCVRNYGESGEASVTIRGTTGAYDPQYEGYHAPKVNDGKWHFVAAVYDGAREALYVDGVLAFEFPATGDIASTTAPLAIGGHVRADGSFGKGWTGFADEIRVYNMALSDAQLEQIFTDECSKAYFPQPETGAADVAWDTALAWQAKAAVASQTISWGTKLDPNGMLVSAYNVVDEQPAYSSQALDGAARQFVIPGGSLELDTTYYWQVDTVIDGVEYTGDVWSMTVRGLNDFSEPKDKLVDNDDLGILVGNWLVDGSGHPEPIIICDGEFTEDKPLGSVWVPATGNISGDYGTGNFTQVEDPNNPGNNVVKWDFDAGANGAGFAVKVNPSLPLNIYDKVKFRAKITSDSTLGNMNMYLWTADNGISVISATVATGGKADDQWYEYTIDVSSNAWKAPEFRLMACLGGGTDAAGTMYIDDLRLVADDGVIECVNRPVGDLNNDCVVDMKDLAIFAEDWMLDAN